MHFGFCLQYEKNGSNVTASIDFGDQHSIFVSDKEMQNAIESSKYFKTGIIEVTKGTVDIPENSDSSVTETKEYPDVTNIQQAKEVLRTDYGVAPVALSNAEKIKSQAEKHFVAFPNIVWG